MLTIPDDWVKPEQPSSFDFNHPHFWKKTAWYQILYKTNTSLQVQLYQSCILLQTCDITRGPSEKNPGSKLSNVRKIIFFPHANYLIGRKNTIYENGYPGPFRAAVSNLIIWFSIWYSTWYYLVFYFSHNYVFLATIILTKVEKQTLWDDFDLL